MTKWVSKECRQFQNYKYNSFVLQLFVGDSFTLTKEQYLLDLQAAKSSEEVNIMKLMRKFFTNHSSCIG